MKRPNLFLFAVQEEAPRIEPNSGQSREWNMQQNPTNIDIWNIHRAPSGRLILKTSSWRPWLQNLCLRAKSETPCFQGFSASLKPWQNASFVDNNLHHANGRFGKWPGQKLSEPLFWKTTLSGKKSRLERVLSKSTSFTGISGQALPGNPKRTQQRASIAKRGRGNSRILFALQSLMLPGHLC